MRRIEVCETDTAGVRNLKIIGGRPMLSADPIQEAGMTRGDLPFIRPVAWCLLSADEISLMPDTSGCTPLRRYCADHAREGLDGDVLFVEVLSAVDALRDHLFTPIEALLTPDFIFVSNASSGNVVQLSLLTLPFPDLDAKYDLQALEGAVPRVDAAVTLMPDSGIPGETCAAEDCEEEKTDESDHTTLPDWFATTFRWDDPTHEAARVAWEARLNDTDAPSPSPFERWKEDPHPLRFQDVSPAILDRLHQNPQEETMTSARGDLEPGPARGVTNRRSAQPTTLFTALEHFFQRHKASNQNPRHPRAGVEPTSEVDVTENQTRYKELKQMKPYSVDDAPDRDKETGMARTLFRRLFGNAPAPFEEESTEDLDLSANALRIASLSEGLPGTPDETLGRHAYVLTDDFLIGRDIRKADFALEDPGISRFHARITRSGGNFFIEDLGSRNGTTVDGIKLKKNTVALLPEKCRIAFGDAVFYFQSD